MPRHPLLITTKVIGSLCSTATTISSKVICAPPSPHTHTTLWSGLPNAAPMAAGMPKPIVPMPPEDRKWREWVWRKYWAHHIWC